VCHALTEYFRGPPPVGMDNIQKNNFARSGDDLRFEILITHGNVTHFVKLKIILQ
jgi:hypothetical protein